MANIYQIDLKPDTNAPKDIFEIGKQANVGDYAKIVIFWVARYSIMKCEENWFEYP